MQEQFWEILSGDRVASESRLGHETGTGHLAHLCSWGAGREHPSPEVPGRLHGLRFSPWVGELRLEQDPSHLLSLVVSPAVQPIQGPVCGYGHEIINQTEGQILLTRKARRLPSLHLSSYLCCPDISLKWRRADWGIGKPRCTWYMGLAGWPKRPCFLVGYRWYLGLVFSRCRCSSGFYTLSKLSARSCFLNVCVCGLLGVSLCRIFSGCGPLASHCRGFSCGGVRALDFSSCGSRL